ncbi:LOW QUALITY PROTEIN: serine/threonine-protein kinase haspin [Antechinus flavipes]|uniref:LOW QUALITY PROTEIN: serine/threonine-protein kinase haspin n=1 Tax=Antechinus flavipes TaxID=38775 RepID=UPI0022368F96|nr:LOW QUALITY PROTEIN: serine/threonine-protein kinase haspin [Antechinus flavipes]
MAPSRAPRPQARLLRTYGGLGGGRRRGSGRGARARVVAAPWFPARERRRLFSSSSSGLSAGSPSIGLRSGSSSPASAPDSDPDFEPDPTRGSPGTAPRGRRRLRADGPPAWVDATPVRPQVPGGDLEEEEDEEEAAKENRPHRHVTERSWRLRARGQRPGPPLCSTPGPPSEPPPPPSPHTPAGGRNGLSRSILAGLSPVGNPSPGPACKLSPAPGPLPEPEPAPGDSMATSRSLFSPVPEPPEEPRRRPRLRARKGAHKKAAKPALATPALPQSTARKACISGLSCARWKKTQPSQAGPRSEASQPPGQNAGVRGWAQRRASLSFHKKKMVAELQPPGSPVGSLLLDSFGTPGVTPWQTSSMYMLTPNKSLPVAELMLSDAEKVYRECQQEGPLAFGHYLSPDRIKSCEKIGEGVFGEVFRTVVENRLTALKVIAIEGQELVNGSPQKTFGEILPEIIISKELSLLSEEAPNRTEGFIGLFAARCVQGPYPEALLQAWDSFRSRRGSENQRPDFFGPGQLYVVLEFEFGGVDLEHMRKQLSSVAAAKSLLHQVTAALAVAEAALHFEHRDLHWGNVLVKRTSAKELGYTLNGQAGTIATHGIHVNIIDYTLSRLEKDGLVVFCDLSQERELFQGQGDYQFEMYRLMKKRTRNRWAQYQPYSNVLWLHYLADKVLKEMVFKKKVSTAPMRLVRQQIQAFYESALAFGSATELLQSHSLFR